MTGLLEFLVDLSTDNSHGFQLSLFALIGRLELPHPLCQVVFLHLLPLPELPAPEPGLAVRRQQPQPQLLDARLNSCHKTESPAELFPRHLVIMDFTLSQTLTFKNSEATLKKMKRQWWWDLFMMRKLQRAGKWWVSTLNPFLLLLFIWRAYLKAFVSTLYNKKAFFPFFIWQRLQEKEILVAAIAYAHHFKVFRLRNM